MNPEQDYRPCLSAGELVGALQSLFAAERTASSPGGSHVGTAAAVPVASHVGTAAAPGGSHVGTAAAPGGSHVGTAVAAGAGDEAATLLALMGKRGGWSVDLLVDASGLRVGAVQHALMRLELDGRVACDGFGSYAPCFVPGARPL